MIFKISVKARLQLKYFELRNHLVFHEKIRKGVNFDKFSNFKLSFWLNKRHHGCFLRVLKILEQLISEHVQTDDSAVEEKTPTRFHLLKFQASKQLFSNSQPVHVTVIKSLIVF